MNIAPEFGVTETIAFLRLLDENKLDQYKKQFISLAYESKKMEKVDDEKIQMPKNLIKQ